MATMPHGNTAMATYIMTKSQGTWYRYPIQTIPVFAPAERPPPYPNGPMKAIPNASPVRMQQAVKQPDAAQNSESRILGQVVFPQGPKVAQLYPAPNATTDRPVDLSLGSTKQTETPLVKAPEPPPMVAKPVIMGNVKGNSHMTTPQISSMQCTYMLCSYCPFKAHSKDEIQSHIVNCHLQHVVAAPKSFTCNYCTYLTSSELCMVRHLLTLHRAKILPARPGNSGTNNLFSCSVCSFSSDEQTMIGHMLDHYNNSTPCSKCASCINWNRSFLTPTRKRKIPRQTSTNRRKASPRKTVADDSEKASSKSVLAIGPQPKEVKTHKCKACTAYFLTEEQLNSHRATHQKQVAPIPNLPTPTTPSSEQPALHICKTTAISAPVPQVTPDLSSSLSVSPPVCDVLTPPASECETLAADSPPALILPEAHVMEEDVAPCLPRDANATDAICATSALVANRTETVSTSVMPTTTNPQPVKKRKLAVKIFKNSLGEYESERPSTPHFNSAPLMEKNQDEVVSTTPVNLCVKVPLKALPVLRNLAPKPNQKNVELPRLQSPTALQLPFDSLPNAKKLYEIASRVDQDRQVQKTTEKPKNHDDASHLLPPPTSFHQASACIEPNDHSESRGCGRNILPQEEIKTELRRQESDEFGGLPHLSKLMANRLKARLANIPWKTRQGSEPANKQAEPAGAGEPCVDTVGMPSAKCTSSLFERVLSNDSEAFIDLTLDDSSDEENDDANAAPTVDDIVCLRKECQVKVTNLSINLEPVRTESTRPPSEGSAKDASCQSTDNASDVIPSTKDMATKVDASVETAKPPEANGEMAVGAGGVENGDVKPLLKPKLTRHYKNVRRSASRLPTLPDSSSGSFLNSEDLVICPYCPKRLLFRLLPAHVQFHGSDCEHKCRECNFASSFKWALDTHIMCHKDPAPADARQITEAEWKSLENEALADDEELEMTQRLLIREETQQPSIPLPCKRQTAKKTIAKKTSSTLSSAVIKKLLSSATTEPVAPVSVNKSRALSTEDFFARMLTERAHHK